MPKYNFDITTVSSTLDDETVFTEALLIPDIKLYGGKLSLNLRFAKNKARSFFEDEDRSQGDIHRYQVAGLPEISQVTVTVEPAKKSPTWTEPVELKFHYVKWHHGDNTIVVFVPVLDIAVLTDGKTNELEELIINHIKFALYRKKFTKSLWHLSQLQRVQEIQIDELSLDVIIKTPKQRVAEAASQQKGSEKKQDPLKEVATEFSVIEHSRAYEIDDILKRMGDALSGKNPGSILLVGPSGAGKTAAVFELFKRRREFNLKGKSFWATSGSRLVAGMSGFGMWQDRCRKLCQEAEKTDTIIHMGNLIELMDVGKSLHNNIGIATFFKPYLARGDLSVIVECTPTQLPVIEREDSHLLEIFQQIEVKEPTRKQFQEILLSCAIEYSDNKLVIDEEALDILDRLHRRYATYSAYPGRPLRFMKNLVKDIEADETVTPGDVTAAFSRETGLPLSILDDSIPLNSEETKTWFADRVMGQPEAIESMADLLSVVKSRLSRPKKPLMSMLFIGPTGVGKTELAKALAEFLFNDRNRLIRFDMSEFASPAGAIRLISGARDAEGLLTTKVRENPFSVVLLDEFEKAHPDVFDLFLQVFGEGRLTDAKGRVADFCNTVIIMTSNLGVESFKKQTTGFSKNADTQNQARDHFTSTVRKFLRPEMFNRIDAIVPFSPLDLETVQQIAKREIGHVLKRDGIQMRNIEIGLDDNVAGYLAQEGFDPKYGARPLKRTIEEQLISPLAHQLNTYPESEELLAFVKIQDNGLCIDVSRKSQTGDPQKPAAAEIRVKNIVSQCVSLRQDFRILKMRPEMMDIVNQIYRLKRVQKRSLKKPGMDKTEEVRSKRLSDLQYVRHTFKDLEHQANMLEFDLLINIYEKKPFDEKDIEHQLAMIHQDLRRLLISIYRLKFHDPDYVTLAVFGEDPETLFDLAHAYFSVAKKLTGSEITVFSLRGGYSTAEGKRTVIREEIKKPQDFLLQPVKGIVGVLFGIRADNALPKLMPEQGWHEFKKKKKTYKCFVHTSSQAHGKYKVPEGTDKPGGIQSKEKRRTYSYAPMEVFDSGINKKLFWQGAVDTVLNTAVEKCFEKEIQSLLDA